MSQFYEYNWPTSVTNGVALLQTGVANTALVLNGSYANQTTGTINFLDFGIVPRITFTSKSDLHGMSFNITGYQNGVLITETLGGPGANNTVISVNCFDVIQSIISNGASNNIQVGVGETGYFPFIRLNSEKKITNPAYALNFVVAADNPASYTVYLSLTNVANLGTYDNLITNGIFQVKTAAATVSALIQYTDVAKNLLIKVNPNDKNSVLKAQFLQL